MGGGKKNSKTYLTLLSVMLYWIDMDYGELFTLVVIGVTFAITIIQVFTRYL